jgi:hypothetical protein
MLPFKIPRRQTAPSVRPMAGVSAHIPTSPAVPVRLEQKPAPKRLIKSLFNIGRSTTTTIHAFDTSFKIDNSTTFKLVTSELIQSISNNVKALLNSMGYNAEITYMLNDWDINYGCNSNICYIIIYNSRPDKKLPKKYIVYQVEQTNYINFNTSALEKSSVIWEMAIKNYEKYSHIHLNKIFVLPIPFNYTEHDNVIYDDYKYDILFYGAENTRRRNILNAIKDKGYNLKIGFGIVGDTRDNMIKQSKIVLNLHYYENPTLETTRINEILQFNKVVISEKTYSEKEYVNNQLYGKFISFVDIINNDLSNINNLFNTIDMYLKPDDTYINKIHSIKNNKHELMEQTKFFLQKNLLAIHKTPNINMNYNLEYGKILCLGLCETPDRYNGFINQSVYKQNSDLFRFYPAIKYSPGWKGCGMSYYNMIYNAKRCGMDTITICEDDCCFKEDFMGKYDIIQTFLKKIQWDIFVGVVANLPENTVISKIYSYCGMTFIEANKMHSMVFNIYNSKIYDAIMKWDYNDSNVDLNTIDQYIKRLSLRIIIPYPFEFSCLNIDSTLWGTNLFNQYNEMFSKSNKVIQLKIADYMKTKSVILV